VISTAELLLAAIVFGLVVFVFTLAVGGCS
jgi:hypothetical protein